MARANNTGIDFFLSLTFPEFRRWLTAHNALAKEEREARKAALQNRGRPPTHGIKKRI